MVAFKKNIVLTNSPIVQVYPRLRWPQNQEWPPKLPLNPPRFRLQQTLGWPQPPRRDVLLSVRLSLSKLEWTSILYKYIFVLIQWKTLPNHGKLLANSKLTSPPNTNTKMDLAQIHHYRKQTIHIFKRGRKRKQTKNQIHCINLKYNKYTEKQINSFKKLESCMKSYLTSAWLFRI